MHCTVSCTNGLYKVSGLARSAVVVIHQIKFHGLDVSVRVSQLPLVSSVCSTGHKLQGRTLDSVGMIGTVGTNLPAGWLYTALSRVRSLADLYLFEPLVPGDDGRVFRPRPNIAKEMERLREIARTSLVNASAMAAAALPSVLVAAAAVAAVAVAANARPAARQRPGARPRRVRLELLPAPPGTFVHQIPARVRDQMDKVLKHSLSHATKRKRKNKADGAPNSKKARVAEHLALLPAHGVNSAGRPMDGATSAGVPSAGANLAAAPSAAPLAPSAPRANGVFRPFYPP